MIPNLHLQPTPLDSAAHRQWTLQVPIADWSMAARLNVIFLATAEFGDACREYPIVFIKVGTEPDGSDMVAPIAVMGLLQDQNLFLDATGRWRGRYMPASLRSYPFCIARTDNSDSFVVCVDTSFAGLGEADTGQPLFEPDGKPTPMLRDMTQHLEAMEAETQRTRLAGKRLLELGLLQDMRFDVTLPGGRQHSMDGFLTIDAKKATELPDAAVCELHRNGILGLMHLHWVSLGNMQRLVEWHVERGAIGGPAAANDPAAKPAP